MIRTHRLFTALAVASALTLPAASARADALADAVAKIDGAVVMVRTIDGWKDGGKDGRYRIVLASGTNEAPAARLFIQWIGAEANGVAPVARSIEIPEFAAAALKVGGITAEAEGGGLTVFIEIANPSGDDPASYELIVEDDGSYRFDPASN